MQVQPVTWVNFWIEAVKILGPAIITGVITWLAMRNQLKMKDAEIGGQMRIKARELMFTAYEKRMEESIRQASEFGAVLGKAHGAFLLKDPNSMREASILALEAIAKFQQLFVAIEVLEREITEAGLFDKYKGGLSFIKNLMQTKNQDHDPETIAKFIWDAINAAALLHDMQIALIEKKREELFSEYLLKA